MQEADDFDGLRRTASSERVQFIQSVSVDENTQNYQEQRRALSGTGLLIMNNFMM